MHISATAHGALQGGDHGLPDHEAIVTRTAIKHAGGGGCKAVVASAAHQGFGDAAVAERVDAAAAQVVDGRLAKLGCCTAEDHVAFARRDRGGHDPGRADDQVGQAVAVHVASSIDRGAAVVVGGLSIDGKPAHA